MKKSTSILWSLNYAMEGLVYALRTQRNMRIHIFAAIVVAAAALVLGVRDLELLAVIFAISMVFVTELINTAVEAAVDVATEGYDPLAKVAKDVAAGAVLVASVNAVFVAYLVLAEPAVVVLDRGLRFVRFGSSDLTVIALGLVMVATILLKAISREGTWLSGGWPSGHAAVAFGAATVVGFITGSAGAMALAYFIAFLVVQSRVEAEIHSVPQSIVGTGLGIALVTLVFQLFFRR